MGRKLCCMLAARLEHFPCMDAAHRRNKGMLTLRSLRELQVPTQAQTNLPANVEAETLRVPGTTFSFFHLKHIFHFLLIDGLVSCKLDCEQDQAFDFEYLCPVVNLYFAASARQMNRHQDYILQHL